VKQGYKLNTEEIISCSKLFEDEFTLENLGRDKIVAMCRYMGILPFGTTSYLRNQLIRKLEELKEDDEVRSKFLEIRCTYRNSLGSLSKKRASIA
jgi:LETM1 and EF-hand domain-containing protein 1